MRSSRQGAIPSDIGWLIDELDGLSERLRTLETPSGESLSASVAKLTDLITDIQARLDTWEAGRWTNAQITTEINNANTAHDAAAVTLGSSLTVAGATQLNGTLKVPDAYNFDITYTRRTAWLGDDGRLGYASSSRDKKTAILPADAVRLLRLLDVEPKSFLYRAEVERQTQLRIDDGIDYTPARELGLMAQDLDGAGLREFVIYGEDGEPDGIEYGMLTVALLSVARSQRAEIHEIDRRLSALEGAAG